MKNILKKGIVFLMFLTLPSCTAVISLVAMALSKEETNKTQEKTEQKNKNKYSHE